MTGEPEAIRRLYELHTMGAKLGLERTQALLDRMGNPERQLAVIHVAGTNGKGSVCAMLDSILRAAGYKTGIYTSPHLIRLNERIRVNGRCIPDTDLIQLIDEVEGHAQAIRSAHGEVTFFEFTTALAFEYFRRSGASLVVAEVGMGGRLDSTNVVMPLLSVITGISVEHAMYLGPDVPSIAREKAGIIKKGRPVVCGNLPDDALAVIRQIASANKAPMVLAADAVSARLVSQSPAGQKIAISGGSEDYSTVTLPLLGRHQVENCALAVAAVEEMSRAASLPVPADAVREGLRTVDWPGRCQVMSTEPLTILDGGHNPGAAEKLNRAVKDLAKKRPVALVFGMCDDKDVEGFLRPFADIVKACWVVTIRTDRAIPRARLAKTAAGFGWRVKEAGLGEAIDAAKLWATENKGVVCIAGSLYLAGEVLELVGYRPFEPRPGLRTQ